MPTKASALVKDVNTLKAILKRMRSCAEPLKNKSGLLMECRRITLSIKRTRRQILPHLLHHDWLKGVLVVLRANRVWKWLTLFITRS